MPVSLVCSKAVCRLVIETTAEQSARIKALRWCPECGSAWTTVCPHCGTVLRIKFRDGQAPRCAACAETLKPESEDGKREHRQNGLASQAAAGL